MDKRARVYRLIEMMKELGNKPMATAKIKSEYNKRYYRRGFGSTNELAQILTKSAAFEKVDESGQYFVGGRVRRDMATWKLK